MFCLQTPLEAIIMHLRFVPSVSTGWSPNSQWLELGLWEIQISLNYKAPVEELASLEDEKDKGRKWSSIGREPPAEPGLVSTTALDSSLQNCQKHIANVSAFRPVVFCCDSSSWLIHLPVLTVSTTLLPDSWTTGFCLRINATLLLVSSIIHSLKSSQTSL